MCHRFASDYNTLNQLQKSYIKVFRNGDSYYPAGILAVSSQQKKTLKTLEQDVKCVNRQETTTTTNALFWCLFC